MEVNHIIWWYSKNNEIASLEQIYEINWWLNMDKQITMKIPAEMYEDLKKLANQKDNIPLANLIRRAIDDYLRKNRLKGNLWVITV